MRGVWGVRGHDEREPDPANRAEGTAAALLCLQQEHQGGGGFTRAMSGMATARRHKQRGAGALTAGRTVNSAPSSSQVGASFLQWPHQGA